MNNLKPKRVIIVGGGPAGLMVASQLLRSNCSIQLFDHKPTIGRKLLVAGNGGFNLTHSEELTSFLDRYDSDWIKDAVQQFTPTDFRHFLAQMGIETRIGSSGKVFPVEHIKPIQVLNAWVESFENSVHIQHNTTLIDWNETEVIFNQKGENSVHQFDFLVLALGGKSWSKTGSDGEWLSIFKNKSIPVSAFESSNSGMELPQEWRYKMPGTILKNVVCKAGDFSCSGDVVLTKYGLEGKPIYALNSSVRKQINKHILIDFKPQSSKDQIVQILQKHSKMTDALKALKLSAVAIYWLKQGLSKAEFLDSNRLSESIKAFYLPVLGFRPIDEVISTVGGVEIDALTSTGFLKDFPTIACCGEMLNWDAPTGGYLIQGCVSSGALVGKAIQQIIDRSEED